MWEETRQRPDVCTGLLSMTQHRPRIGASDGRRWAFSFPPKPAQVVGASSSSSPSVHSSIINPARLRQLAPSQGTYARLTFLPSTFTPRSFLNKTWHTWHGIAMRAIQVFLHGSAVRCALFCFGALFSTVHRSVQLMQPYCPQEMPS